MITLLRKNFYIVTSPEKPCETLLEYKNILKMCDMFESSLTKEDFDNTLFVFASLQLTRHQMQEATVLELDTEGYKKRVLIWISEEYGRVPSDNILAKYDLIFKEYMREEYPEKHLFAMPLILPSEVPELEIISMSKRTVSACFSGNLNSNRVPMYAAINSNMPLWERMIIPFIRLKRGGWRLANLVYGDREFDLSSEFKDSVLRFNNGFNKGLPKKEYARLTANSKIILSPRGFTSSECFRMYEGMRQGCVVINEVLPELSHYQNIPVVQVKSWKGVKKIINKLLDNPDLLEQMSKNTIDFYKKKLSLEAVVNTIIEKIRFL